jgi:hypothetical protein
MCNDRSPQPEGQKLKLLAHTRPLPPLLRCCDYIHPKPCKIKIISLERHPLLQRRSKSTCQRLRARGSPLEHPAK